MNHTSHTQAMAKDTYVAHRLHRRSVPGTDVRVERPRLVKRLKAEPHALKEPSPHEPEPRWVCSVLGACSVLGPSACGAMCRRSTVEMRRNCSGGMRTKTGESLRAVHVRPSMYASILPENSEASMHARRLARARPTGMGPVWAQQRAIPSQRHGSGSPMQQQHSVWAKHGSKARVRVRARACAEAQQCRTEMPTDDGAPQLVRRFCTRRRGSTWYMLEALATFHLLMSALKVGFALNRFAMVVTAAVFQSAMLPYVIASPPIHAVTAAAMLPSVSELSVQVAATLKPGHAV
jgi:hypothetical protein